MTKLKMMVTAGLIAACAMVPLPEGDEAAQAQSGWTNPFPEAVMPTSLSAEEEANVRTVLSLYEAALNAKDFAAASRFLGPRYVQHNPAAADGAEGLRAFIDFLRKDFPQSRSEVKRVVADGDHVFLHVHSLRTPGTLGNIVGDIFRLEGGKVVEHWDVVHPLNLYASPENPNGAFAGAEDGSRRKYCVNIGLGDVQCTGK